MTITDKKLLSGLIFTVSAILSFFDFNNRLNVGPHDSDGNNLFNHGILGNTLKALLVLIGVSTLYYLLLLITKNKMTSFLLTPILIAALAFLIAVLSISVWGLF